MSAYNIEKNKKKTFLQNQVVQLWMTQFILSGVMLYSFGWKVFMIVLLSGFQSVIYLEAINYLEHYGLRRKEIEPGVYEKTNITHSWNASYFVSNLMTYKL